MKIIVNNNNQSISSDKVMRQLLRGIFDTTKTLVMLFFSSLFGDGFCIWLQEMLLGTVARHICLQQSILSICFLFNVPQNKRTKIKVKLIIKIFL